MSLLYSFWSENIPFQSEVHSICDLFLGLSWTICRDCDPTWLEYGCIVYFLVLFTFLYKKNRNCLHFASTCFNPHPPFCGFRDAHLLSFMCRVLVLLAFVLCYMPNVAGVSELSMRNCSIQFSVKFIVLIFCVYISSR